MISTTMITTCVVFGVMFFFASGSGYRLWCSILSVGSRAVHLVGIALLWARSQ